MISDNLHNIVLAGGGADCLVLLLALLKRSKLYALLNGQGIIVIDKNDNLGGGDTEKQLVSTNYPIVDSIRHILKEPESQFKVTSNSLSLFQKQDLLKFIFETLLKKDNQNINFQKRESKANDEVVLGFQEICLPVFRELLETSVVSEIINCEYKQGPKQLQGYFFKILGNTLLRQIKIIKKKQIFRNN